MTETQGPQPADPTTAFADRLQAFERDGDPGPLVELFAEDAELSKLDGLDVHRGRDGAERFWRDYRSVFEDLRSEFTATTRGQGRSVLEWVARATVRSPGGGPPRPLHYPGVSILEFDDAGNITRFRTVYDSGPFVTPRADAD